MPKNNIYTLGKKVLATVASGKKDEAFTLYSNYSSALDKVGRKSIIHPNRASARKASMMKKINAIG